MRSRDQHGRGHRGCFIYNSLLQVSLDLCQKPRIGNGCKHSNRVGAVEVDRRVHVLHQARSNDDDLVGSRADIFDDEVDHPSKGRVPGLEELGHAEKDLGGFLLRESLPLDEQVEELGDDLLAAARVDVSVIEAAGVLEGCSFLDAVEGGVLDWWSFWGWGEERRKEKRNVSGRVEEVESIVAGVDGDEKKRSLLLRSNCLSLSFPLLLLLLCSHREALYSESRSDEIEARTERDGVRERRKERGEEGGKTIAFNSFDSFSRPAEVKRENDLH